MEKDKLWKKPLAITATALIVTTIVVVGVLWWFGSTTVVLVVRHAERNDAASCESPRLGPPISSNGGQERAQTLAHVCGGAGVTAIYASEFCRTQQTVEPLANQLGLTINAVNQYGSDNSIQVDDLIAQVWANNTGRVILIAGHSDTVPVIIAKLGGGTIAPILPSEFDNLFVVTIVRHWWWWRWPGWTHTKVVRLKYGAPT